MSGSETVGQSRTKDSEMSIEATKNSVDDVATIVFLKRMMETNKQVTIKGR